MSADIIRRQFSRDTTEEELVTKIRTDLKELRQVRVAIRDRVNELTKTTLAEVFDTQGVEEKPVMKVINSDNREILIEKFPENPGTVDQVDKNRLLLIVASVYLSSK